MMKLTHMRVGLRLGLGFGAVFALLILVAGVGLRNMSATNQTLTSVVELNVLEMELLEKMSYNVSSVSFIMRDIALLKDPDQRKKKAAMIPPRKGRYEEALGQFAKLPLDAAGLAFIQQLKPLEQAGWEANNHVVELAEADDPGAVDFIMTKAGSTSKKWQDEIRHYMEEQRKRGQQQAAAAAKAYEKARTGMVVLTLCALGGGLAFAWFIARSIVQPLQQAVALAGTVAAGDLTGHIEVDTTDRSETAQMLRALDEMNGSLRRIVAEVRGGTETISTASAEIASGNMNLSERTEQQASALEETTASMEDLAGTVRKNADHAEQASQLSRSASLIAAEGGSAVGKVVTTMEAIDTSSRRIVEIISVIDAIAFQTNILALNAAVEAARAGEQGRGFAVVAGEVRTLAQRSAAAARDIKDLIGQSADQVNAGTRVVAEAGETMKEVVSAIERVNTLVHEIASASQEQRSGIDEVQRAVTEMDHVTQQNAALVEEVAATATSLQEQTAHLARVVSTFKVDAAETRSPRLAARHAAQPRALPASAA